MLFAGFCIAVTMNGGAPLPDRGAFAMLNGSGVGLPPPNLFEPQHGATPDFVAGRWLLQPIGSAGAVGAVGIVGAVSGSGAAGLTQPTADGVSTAARTSRPSPLKRGAVERYLEAPDVKQGVQELLSAISEGLPGYSTILEVVKDPDENPAAGFVMVSVCMREDDRVAWDFVERLIDEHWLAFQPHVRAALGVGRELIPVG